MKTLAAVGIAVVALSLYACSSVSPLVVSGEALAAVGNQFADTADAMNRGVDSGAVTVEQYRAWRSFGQVFQTTYPHTVALWEVARVSGDKKLEAEVTAILGRMILELAAFKPPASADGGT